MGILVDNQSRERTIVDRLRELSSIEKAVVSILLANVERALTNLSIDGNSFP